MSYYNYYLEFRNRILLVGVSWISSFVLCYFCKEKLSFYFIEPVFNNKFLNLESFYFIFTNITEIFDVYLGVIFLISNQISFIFICYHIVSFLYKGLLINEQKKIKKLSILTFLSFFISLSVFKFSLPVSWNFFLSFGSNYIVNLTFENKLLEYFNFSLNVYFFCLLLTIGFFSFFFFLSEIKKWEVVVGYRKIFYLCFFLFSTVITPPDIFSQIFLGLFICFVFEVFVFFSCFNKEAN